MSWLEKRAVLARLIVDDHDRVVNVASEAANSSSEWKTDILTSGLTAGGEDAVVM